MANQRKPIPADSSDSCSSVSEGNVCGDLAHCRRGKTTRTFSRDCLRQDVIQDYKALSPMIKPHSATTDEALDEELDEALDEELDEALTSIDTTINEALDEEFDELFKSSSGGLRREDFSLLFQTAPC